MKKRLDKIEYYLNIAREVARRSACFRAQHGAIIVRDDQIISTGYIGAPRKTRDCLERGNCLRNELAIPSGQRYEMCRSVHAEQNAIINAARAGVSLLGGTMYVYSERVNSNNELEIIKAYPCFICKKMIINAGLKEFVSQEPDNSFKVYQVSDWVSDWQENDLLDDVNVYGEKFRKNK
ncbi:MAG: deoxycytidylate deaminase [Patescibacteria group bacterium]|jgi:dCMP deaminase|nr:dCMP deaminase family protein [Patescibacteria group bacterium]